MLKPSPKVNESLPAPPQRTSGGVLSSEETWEAKRTARQFEAQLTQLYTGGYEFLPHLFVLDELLDEYAWATVLNANGAIS